MLTRPGSKPGPTWMRNISDSLADPDRACAVMMPFWAFFILYLLAILLLTHFITAIALSKDHIYESPTHIAGLPLLSYGPVAHAIIAVGGRATGVIALGGIAAGFIAFGGLNAGVVSIGGVSVGLLSIAGVALGWRAMGGLAVGEAALGSLAVGRYAYAGNGIAYGAREASGRQKEHLLE
jgi:hypothetical protein